MKTKAPTGPGRLVASILALTFLAVPAFAADDLTEPEVAVEAGREALESHWNLPWYDASNDSLEPVDLQLPRKPWGFWKWLDNLFNGWNLDLSGVLKFLGWLIVLGLLTWIVVALIRAYQQAELSEATQAADLHDARAHIDRIEALPVSIEEPVGDFLQAARRAYEAGDLTRAIVYLFSHQLIELDRRSYLRLVKGKTNRQYLRELRRGKGAAGQLADILSRTTGLFEAAFFGAHTPTESSFKTCWDEAQEFDRLLPPAEEA